MAAARPVQGRATPVWRGVFRLAAADPAAHPWRHVQAVAPDENTLATHHLGFVRVAAGTVPHRT